MTTFEKQIEKIYQKREKALDYLYNLKEYRLTNGFWNKYGYSIYEQLNFLKENHKTEWEAFCNKHNLSKNMQVEDLFC
jgi:hypothetical protein